MMQSRKIRRAAGAHGRRGRWSAGSVPRQMRAAAGGGISQAPGWVNSGPGAVAPVAWLPALAVPVETSFRERCAAAGRTARDLVLCSAMLVATLPVVLIAAGLIRLESPGPIFYRQMRVGLHDRPFMLLKFRSMRLDAERDGPRWADHKDPRVTRVGGFLRMTRIDELPQLLNVLAGQMSLIGPRPERPHFVAQLAQIIPGYHQRTSVLPGITGWAQVNYPYGASVEDARHKLVYDLYYVRHRSLALDLRILLKTIRVVLLGTGAR